VNPARRVAAGPAGRTAAIVLAVFVAGAVAAASAAAFTQPLRHVQRAADAACSSALAVRAFLRVNQVGYPAGAPKRAYLMANVSIPAGTTFAVRDASQVTVYSAAMGARRGRWSDRYPYVYALDFSAVTAPGTYTLTIAGATSPSFLIDSGTAVYAQALANTLSFYQVQRDGADYVPGPLRDAPAHVNDAHAMTYRTPKVDADGNFTRDPRMLGLRIDASGGWWDAGDYLKFVHTTSYTVALLLAGVRDYPAQMGAASATSDFTAEARFGADWLLRMWDDDRKVLYYQVGIGGDSATRLSDHDLWRLPQVDDTYRVGDPAYRYIRHRPVFRAGPPGSRLSPNLAGRDSAALAEAYTVFKASDPAFADRCLLAAEHIFALADVKPGRLMTAIPYDFYPEIEWRDDMELGATELYFAVAAGGLPAGLPHTDPAFYLSRGARWARAYIDGSHDAADTLNLYDVSGLAHVELYRAIGQAGDPAGLAVTRAALLADLKKALDRAVARAGDDPFQFGLAWGQWDTTCHGAGLAVMASEYDQLTGTSAYAAWSSRWLADILGANAWGTSLIVGDGTTFPDCLQHQVANLKGTLDGTSPVLLGACVEGPNSETDNGVMPHMRLGPSVDRFKQFDGHGAIWRDAVQNYPNTEPAIDLTAPSALAFARMMAGQY